MASSSLDHLLGLLRVRVVRGVNLAVRDVRSSDPYVVLKMGNQSVFDHDTFTVDDNMGDAEFDIEPFVEAARMPFEGIPDGTIIRKLEPNGQNCLSEESRIVWYDGKVVQNMTLRLRNVACGEVELQLQWINLHGSKVFQR